MQQQHRTTDPRNGDPDPLTPGLPKSVKPIQSIVWAFIAIGVVGLILAIILVANR
jgi:hypothetical protein